MNSRVRIGFWLVLLAMVAVALFFVFRRDTQAEYGPPVALCPGPDHYGYICEPGGNYAYIDATTDTGLYADDGVITLSLPFAFTFYGTTYTSLTVGSNGTVQLGDAGVAEYANGCLDDGPIAAMGDLIAPYWDDLTLTYAGFLETAVVGEVPNRIFVIEWDKVPRFNGDLDDGLTFAVQLFEGSNDIVFLYQEVAVDTGRGSSATVGLQSAAQGLALQYSCNQPTLADALGIAFPHPPAANEDVGLGTAVLPNMPPMLAAKGPAQELLTRLNQRAPGTLDVLQRESLAQNPPRQMVWHERDLTGNGRAELLVLWHSTAEYPHLSHLAVIGAAEDGYVLLLDEPLSSRGAAVQRMILVEMADLTGDGLLDALLWDEVSGQTRVITQESGVFSLLPLPESCQDVPLWRNGQIACRPRAANAPMMMAVWNGREFTQTPRP